MLINKNEFVEIINRLKNYDKLQNDINNLFNELLDSNESDFTNAGGICIGHETIVIRLLEKIFNGTDLISWWIYETQYGNDFKMGDFIDNGIEIDLSTADKLYEYLERNMKNG